MNTDEVVEMIDAISEGLEFKMDLPGNFGMIIDEDAVSIVEPESHYVSRITDPRTAREIAGALVAWANRQEGKTDVTQKAKVMVNAIAPAGVDFPSVNDWASIKAGHFTREDWVKARVDGMDANSIQRLIEAFEDSAREWAPTSPNFHDVQKAVTLLKKKASEDV